MLCWELGSCITGLALPWMMCTACTGSQGREGLPLSVGHVVPASLRQLSLCHNDAVNVSLRAVTGSPQRCHRCVSICRSFTVLCC